MLQSRLGFFVCTDPRWRRDCFSIFRYQIFKCLLLKALNFEFFRLYFFLELLDLLLELLDLLLELLGLLRGVLDV